MFNKIKQFFSLNSMGSKQTSIKIEKLDQQLKEAAKGLAEGKLCLFPSQGVYTLILDGSQPAVVEYSRIVKGRRPEQREATIASPKRLFEYIDFDALRKINPTITKEVISKLYQSNPVGLVVPCDTKRIPQHLVTHHIRGDQKLPTIMNIWNSAYDAYAMLEEQLLRDHPEVIWAGSSANLNNQESLVDYDEAFKTFGEKVSLSVKDPRVENFPYPGSYTIIDLTQNPPVLHRKGSIHPEKHPEQLQKFIEILPNLVPKD